MKIQNLLSIAVLIALPLSSSCQSQKSQDKSAQSTTEKSTAPATIEHLTTATFKQKVFDYSVNKEWKFAGNKPAIIDFYADWCGPCRMLAPTVAKIAEEYKGKIDVYKVNVDNEQELAGAFGISGIPAVLFIPVSDRPQMSTGLISEEAFNKAIKDVLKVN